MKTDTTKFHRAHISGDTRRSDQEIFSSVLKRWQQRFRYWSIFAAVPAVLVSQLNAPPVEGKRSETSVTGSDATPPRKMNLNGGTRSLLKRQSKFRPPSQNGDDNVLTPSDGPDDCPGRGIAGGTYTAAAPYTVSGDTTDANNTINAAYFYGFGYQTIESPGRDHVYSFILTDRGANPKIEISTTSATFSPVIYLLQGGFPNACSGDKDHFASNGMIYADAKDGVATLNVQNWLPLNIPLYVVIDSRAQGNAGTYTLKMQDMTVAPQVTNPIDSPWYFVHRQYVDFLGRWPDQDGLRFWVNEITSCGADQSCIEARRINDSGAFFLSIEFQETGYLLYRTYKAAYGNRGSDPVPLNINEYWQDEWKLQGGLIVNQTGWQQRLESNKQRFFNDFVGTKRFKDQHPTSISPQEFVDRLFTNTVVPTTAERQAAINEFGATAASSSDTAARGRALRRVAENPRLAQQEFNRAFVLMQYYGYLHRNPFDAPDGDFSGYIFWVNKLDQFNGDFVQAEMVKAFINSPEYRNQFTQ